jgi:hypothetical protein
VTVLKQTHVGEERILRRSSETSCRETAQGMPSTSSLVNPLENHKRQRRVLCPSTRESGLSRARCTDLSLGQAEGGNFLEGNFEPQQRHLQRIGMYWGHTVHA